MREHEAQRRALQRRLAIAIRHLALTNAQIEALPDNYQETIRSGSAAELPRDLMNARGDWVEVGRADGTPVVPIHLHDFGGRSTFQVFVRLPAERTATLGYLERLRAALGGYRCTRVQRSDTGTCLEPPPEELPQFPRQTEWVLLRRLAVLGTDGRVHATRFVEGVQARRYLLVLAADSIPYPEYERAQQVSVFVAQRDRGGTLRAVQETERDFTNVQFRSHGVDPFEIDRSRWQEGEREEPFAFRARTVVLSQCRSCHFVPSGIFSVSTVFSVYSDGGPPAKPIEVLADREVAAQLKWKEQQADFALLRNYR